jgi:hypothetical protein
MATTRYKEAFEQMIHDNKEVFEEFQQIHDAYALNELPNQEAFNEKGKVVMGIVRKYEDILCKRSEVNGFGEYTIKLAEKFQNEVRKHFPKIDEIGIKRMIMKPVEKNTSSFNLRKIGMR